MNGHVDEERLHDLLDGLLEFDEAADVRAHLETCARCRERHETLAETIGALRALPAGATPPAATWDAIAGRISGASGADVVPFPAHRVVRRSRVLSLPQAAAAAVVLSVLSAGTVFLAMRGGAPEPAGTPMAVELTEVDVLPASSLAAAGVEEYDQAVARLEDIVERGRDVLAPETLETLEGSLATIEAALGEVRAAMAADPSSELLVKMLVNHQRAKLRLLRQAAISVQAAS